jgi:antibiotic biosynthesis monooxygenase (ABM) superfamily enzyme
MLDVQYMDTSRTNVIARVRVTHKVKDYEAWKKEFDSHKQSRLDAGLQDRAISYEMGNKNMVTVVFQINDMAKASAFMKSQDLKDKMKAAGIENR